MLAVWPKAPAEKNVVGDGPRVSSGGAGAMVALGKTFPTKD